MYDDLNPGAVAQRANKGFAPKSRPDAPRTAVLLLTEKSSRIEGSLGLGVTALYNEIPAGGNRYSRVPVWADNVYAVRGVLLSEVAGLKPRFADPDEVMVDYKARCAALRAEDPKAKLPPRPASVVLNGREAFPVGEAVEILIPLGDNDEKLKAAAVGSVMVLEGVTVRAKPIGQEAQTLKGALTPAPNSVLEKKGQDGKPVGVLVAYDEKTRTPARSAPMGFFHGGPSRATHGEETAAIGPITVISRPFVATKGAEDRPRDPNDPPLMLTSNMSAMGVVLDMDPDKHLSGATSMQELREYMEGWEEAKAESFKSGSLPAGWAYDAAPGSDSPGVAAATVRFFRLPKTREGEMLTDPADVAARNAEYRAKGGVTSFAFTVAAGRTKVEGGEGAWRQRTLVEAFDAFVAEQAANAAKYRARAEAGRNEDVLATQPLSAMIEGGKWHVDVIPGVGFNFGPMLKKSKYDRGQDFLTWGEARQSASRPTEKGNVVSYDPVMGVKELLPGVRGSHKPKDGEEAREVTLVARPGVTMGYMDVLSLPREEEDENGQMVKVVGPDQQIVTDIRPMSKHDAPLPLDLLPTPGVPDVLVADLEAQRETVAKNTRTADFAMSQRRRAQAPAPKARADSATSAPADEDDAALGPRL